MKTISHLIIRAMKSTGYLSVFLLLINFNCIGQSKYPQKSDEGNTVKTEKVQIDQNYKHQAGQQNVTSNNPVIKEEYIEVSDANYKHQAGQHKKHKENVLTVKSEKGIKRDNNYKHQFPSR